jgi:hypothetical protein
MGQGEGYLAPLLLSFPTASPHANIRTFTGISAHSLMERVTLLR